MAKDKIMEALARIEHKQDLILRKLYPKVGGKREPMEKVGSALHVCPTCEQPVEYQVDINDGVVVRKCGCGTGKIALDMGAFAPPMPSAKKKDEEQDVGDQEDRNNANRRGGRPGRR